ncbi:MAG: carbohydrate ABC transporter permease [Clostridiales bacterium]|jgi:putative aldouronate transport system permease protein|nr:carbohydrate ABC transporter permease [Clostridiales bacterium]
MVENGGKDKVFNCGVCAVAAAYAFVTLLPLLYIVASSFSAPDAVNTGRVGLWPVDFTLSNYARVFSDTAILRGYLNTSLYTVAGSAITLILQFTAAYPLSRRDLAGKKFWNLFFVVPMFVGGGMIPTYIVVKSLKMLNTFWAMIIPGCVGLFNVIVIRTYISTAIPYEMQEAAMIDGAGNLRLFLTIVLPLSRPILAVMTLYAAVGHWNAYFNSLIYITRDELFPLQRVLQRILVSSESNLIGGSLGDTEKTLAAESLKYAIIVAASAPILLIYPFFQRFFEKGLMIGGLKG